MLVRVTGCSLAALWTEYLPVLRDLTAYPNKIEISTHLLV
jgi:hypothetical protein